MTLKANQSDLDDELNAELESLAAELDAEDLADEDEDFDSDDEEEVVEEDAAAAYNGKTVADGAGEKIRKGAKGKFAKRRGDKSNSEMTNPSTGQTRAKTPGQSEEVKLSKAGMINQVIQLMNSSDSETLGEKFADILSSIEGYEDLTEEELAELSAADLAAYKSKGGTVKKGAAKVAAGAKTFKKSVVGSMGFKPKKVTKEDLDVAADISAVFNGTELTEEFKTAATELFEAAVVAKINEQVEAITAELEEEVAAQFDERVEDLTEKVSDYLDYIVESWVKENELAIERGVRADIVEDFMIGLRNLFIENYIDIPEEKVDVVEELSDRVEELEARLATSIDENVDLKGNLVNLSKINIVDELAGDLTESQVEKLFSLVESIDFTDEDAFRGKVEVLKKKYFNSAVTEDKTESDGLEDTSLITEETGKKVTVDPVMNSYVSALSRTVGPTKKPVSKSST
jgi:hypothetical protein